MESDVSRAHRASRRQERCSMTARSICSRCTSLAACDYTVGDDPFHFGPWHVVGPWHAPVIFNDDEDRWYITHSIQPFRQAHDRAPQGRAMEGSVYRRAGVERRGPRTGGPARRDGGLALAARGRWVVAAPIGVRVGRVSPVRP